MKRQITISTSIALAALFAAIAVPTEVRAENYAFQFVCIDNGSQLETPWMDERLSSAVSFAHRTCLSCDEVCINIRDVDGYLYHFPDRWSDPDEVVIRRYAVDLDDYNEFLDIAGTYSTWDLADADIETHDRETGYGAQGVTYCWDVWNDNYWATRYVDGGLGRMTEVTFVDHENQTHTFRAVPVYPKPAGW